MVEAHHIFDQRIGPRYSPYAQKLCLGWVIIGETCLGKVHKPDHINVNKTYVLGNGRESTFKPCQNELKIYEQFSPQKNGIGASVFERTSKDNKLGMAIEDIQFLELMDDEFRKDNTENWETQIHLIAVSNDPESPELLSPSLLVTQKSDMPPQLIGDSTTKNLYKAQWKCVPTLAEVFWKPWQIEYLVKEKMAV